LKISAWVGEVGWGKKREGLWEAHLLLAEKRILERGGTSFEILLYSVFIDRWTVFAFEHVGFIMAAVS